MNIFGMGPLELLVIALVAFIFLGPKKMVDAARLMGKATREVRRMTDELPKIVLDEEQTQPARASSPRSDQDTGKEADDTQDGEAVTDGPVAFRSGRNRGDAGNVEQNKAETREQRSRRQ